MNYFASLSSFKAKHEKMKNGLDFIKIGDYAVINLNNVFPVPNGEYTYADIPTVKDFQCCPERNALAWFYYTMMWSIWYYREVV